MYWRKEHKSSFQQKVIMYWRKEKSDQDYQKRRSNDISFHMQVSMPPHWRARWKPSPLFLLDKPVSRILSSHQHTTLYSHHSNHLTLSDHEQVSHHTKRTGNCVDTSSHWYSNQPFTGSMTIHLDCLQGLPPRNPRMRSPTASEHNIMLAVEEIRCLKKTLASPRRENFWYTCAHRCTQGT